MTAAHWQRCLSAFSQSVTAAASLISVTRRKVQQAAESLLILESVARINVKERGSVLYSYRIHQFP